MENPCRKCVIQACCTTLCEPKKNYTETILMRLSIFCKENVYDKKGFPLPNSKDKSLKKQLDFLKRICDKNNKEVSKIILRGPYTHIIES